MHALSIKQKLMLIIMTASALALLLMAAGSMAYEWSVFGTQLRTDLESQGQIIGDESSGALQFQDRDQAVKNLAALDHNGHIRGAALYAGTNLFAWYPTNAAALTFPAAPEKGPAHYRFDFENDRLTLWQPVRQAGNTIGAIYLQSNLQELRRRLIDTAEIFALLIVLTLAATWLLAARLQRIISTPISHLAQTARIVSTEKNYSVRAQKESEDELGQFTDVFNEMIGHIQKRDGALRHINKELENLVDQRTRDLQQQFDRISLLNRITYAVAARQDFESIVSIVLQQLEERLPVDCSSAYLLDEPAGMLQTIAHGPKTRPLMEQLQIPPSLAFTQTPFTPCLTGEMAYRPDNRRSDLPLMKKFSQAGIFSTLATPLVIEGKTFGVLVLQRRPSEGFSAPELEFIQGLSAHVAQAVQQAQLYQDLQAAYNELRQTQQAVMQQERLKALGQMASGVAHDINNALSPIVGFVELITLTEPNLSPVTQKHLNYIKTAGEDVAHIVERLREFYRPRTARETLAMLNINRVVKQAADLTRPRWRDMPQSLGLMIQLRLDCSPDVPEFAGIEAEIRESLTNLILNAVDAMPAGGTITIRTRAIELGMQKRERVSTHVVLEVTDTGVGMDEETRRRCLEPFFSTKGRRGTGLGLAMVYGVMERHEGKIEIDSEPGMGTTVRLVFPLAQLKPSQPAPAAEDMPPGPFHILCVDDEPLLRELVQEMLERDGHSVETADGGPAGVEAFRAARRDDKPFDVVVTDLGMPYMDGREVAATIKRESPGTPVVMLTGWGAFMKDDADAVAQADGILSKPPRIREIRAMLRKVVKKPDAPAA